MRTFDTVIIVLLALTMIAVAAIWVKVQHCSHRASKIGAALSYAMDFLNRGIVDGDIEKYTEPLREPAFVDTMKLFQTHNTP